MKRSREIVYTRNDLKSRIFYFGSRDTISHCKLLFLKLRLAEQKENSFRFFFAMKVNNTKTANLILIKYSIESVNILVLWLGDEFYQMIGDYYW